MEQNKVHCLWEEGSQTDGASRVDQIRGFNTIAKVEEAAVDHEVVKGDERFLVLRAWRNYWSTEARPRQTCWREITETTTFLLLLQFEEDNEMRAARVS